MLIYFEYIICPILFFFLAFMIAYIGFIKLFLVVLYNPCPFCF